MMVWEKKPPPVALLATMVLVVNTIVFSCVERIVKSQKFVGTMKKSPVETLVKNELTLMFVHSVSGDPPGQGPMFVVSTVTKLLVEKLLVTTLANTYWKVLIMLVVEFVAKVNSGSQIPGRIAT